MPPHKIGGDGACLFRAFSYALTGSEDSRRDIRTKICDVINEDSDGLFRQLIPAKYQSTAHYVSNTGMDCPQTWGTDIEIWAFANLSGFAVRVFMFSTGNTPKVQLFTPSVKLEYKGEKVISISNHSQRHYNLYI